MFSYTVAKEMLGMSRRTDSRAYSGVGFFPDDKPARYVNIAGALP
jgi:hypothetical protein